MYYKITNLFAIIIEFHYKWFNEAIDVVTENIGGTNKTFIYSKDITKHTQTSDAGLPKIWRAEIGSDGCIVEKTQ